MAGRVKWVVPSANDVNTVMSSIVQGAVSVDANGKGRAINALAMAVERVVGAIRTGNRNPVSLTAGAVPPSGRQHTVVLAVDILLASTPNMSFAAKENWTKMHEAAEKWLEDVQSGKLPVDYPTDPDQTSLPLGGVPLWGSDTPVDMTTDGELADYFVAQTIPSANPPQNLVAISGLRHVMLTWDAPSNPPQTPVQYTVMQGTASGQETTVLVQGLMTTTFTDTNVNSGTPYFYTVLAVNAAGTSVASNEATATPQ